MSIGCGVILWGSLEFPIPGGVGISEAILAAGLVALGADEPAALYHRGHVPSSVRPPVWGLYSLRWLRRNEYL